MTGGGDSTQSAVFKASGLALSYLRFGQGERVFIAFHGYGQHAEVYRKLPDASMTVYSFNLPYHGVANGLYNDEQLREGLRPAALNHWLTEFLSAMSIERFSIVGYSMGARIVLSLIEHVAHRVDAAHLIAPDGFILNPAYRFATRTWAGRYIFSKLPRYQSGVRAVARGWQRLGFMDKRVLQLVERHIAGEEPSLQLYNTWTFLRYLHPDVESDAMSLAMKSMDVIVYLGEYDSIIPKAKVMKWKALQENLARAKLFPLGHRLLIEEIFIQLRSTDTVA